MKTKNDNSGFEILNQEQLDNYQRLKKENKNVNLFK